MASLKIGLVVFAVFFFGQGNSTVSVPKKNACAIYNNYNYNGGSKAMLAAIKRLESKLDRVEKKIEASQPGPQKKCKKVRRNCVDVLKCGGNQSGVYNINPDGKGSFKVFCDQQTTGGGWTVFQRRQDGSVNFYRGWHDYKTGFGNLRGEFWLGLDKINRLTHQTSRTRDRLRVELADWKAKTAYAEYDNFAVSSERTKYLLSLGTYSGTAGDSLGYHRGYPFSTKDRDNDSNSGNCAVGHKGAWWYNSCHNSNLNGLYLHDRDRSGRGVTWYFWKNAQYSVKRAEMKIRPVHFTPQ